MTYSWPHPTEECSGGSFDTKNLRYEHNYVMTKWWLRY